MIKTKYDIFFESDPNFRTPKLYVKVAQGGRKKKLDILADMSAINGGWAQPPSR